ncbi:nitrogen assimilation regulatory NtrX domain protein [Orientia tsutsugamushi str. Gilliam]|uniref:Nitrogen assimilation regulatory NtrX domain protein n=1 Tax=Orientia tsutsugamushi str. Gilliam TaxID=1359184 RepID=A0A0F3MDD9_ORITS|nr:nitrogen assimilation regulatory NtrX domain protein [Orientia tsutsugamushi str. Gilliam]
MGAYDYVEKPFTADKIVTVLKRACETARLKKKNIDLKTKVIDRSEIIGQSPAINKLKSRNRENFANFWQSNDYWKYWVRKGASSATHSSSFKICIRTICYLLSNSSY